MVHPKITFLSFTHPQVVIKLYDFLLLNKKEDILKNLGNQTFDGLHWLPWYGKKYCVCVCECVRSA